MARVIIFSTLLWLFVGIADPTLGAILGIIALILGTVLTMAVRVLRLFLRLQYRRWY